MNFTVKVIEVGGIWENRLVDSHDFDTLDEAITFCNGHRQTFPHSSDPNAISYTYVIDPIKGEPMQPPINVEIKLFQPFAKIPAYQTAGAAAFDLHACIPQHKGMLSIAVGETFPVTTGIGIFLNNPDYALFIWERSGLGKKGIQVRAGVVDSDYQGQIMVLLTNLSDDNFVIREGDRIAQAVVTPVQRVAFKEVAYFSQPTARGINGFGSTGA